MSSDVVRERLQKLADSNDGRLTPEMVVRDARDAKSPLHSLFEWDKTKAASAYWLHQAREIIRSVRIVFHDEKTSISVVSYLRDPTARGDEQGYVSISKLRTDIDQAREAVVNEFIRAAGALRRAREVAAVLNLTGEIDGIVERIETVKTSVIQAT